MGSRGPQATPTEILAARGSWRAKLRVGEPQYEVSIPECPSWVPESGREWFRLHAEQAAGAGIMSEPYATALALGAHAYAEFIACSKLIDESGRTTINEKGNTVSNPVVAMRNEAWKQLLLICREFGFSPASKSSIKVGSDKNQAKSDDKSRFFRAG